MAQANGVVDHSGENFAKFFEDWIERQQQDLHTLHSAIASLGDQHEDDAEADRRLRPLVDRVVSHYEDYFRQKSASARRDVAAMFSPAWTSSTEDLFLWVGGWRPTVAFHLLYSKSGVQMRSQLDEIIQGLPARDLRANLTADQLRRIDELHRWTVKEEKEVAEEEAEVQETVADGEMVELTNALTERGDDDEGDEKMEEAMEGKRKEMEWVLEGADQLRMETLRGIVEILRPAQAVHFLIAAAELHLRVHAFGKRKDARQRNQWRTQKIGSAGA